MEQSPYRVLGLQPDATDEEVKNAYRALARKYHPDNYSKDDPLAHLAEEKMKDINEAYDTILRTRAGVGYNASSSSSSSSSSLAYIRDLFAQDQYAAAETELDKIDSNDRSAEWHFLKSICYDRRGRQSDAMNELNIACSMDPNNEEYAQSRNLYANRARNYGNAYRTNTYGGQQQQRSATNDACTCCSNLIIADCCCESMGGDLCRCI